MPLMLYYAFLNVSQSLHIIQIIIEISFKIRNQIFYNFAHKTYNRLIISIDCNIFVKKILLNIIDWRSAY